MGTFSQLALHKSVRNSILPGLSFPIFGLNTEIYSVRESTDQEKFRIRIFFMQYIWALLQVIIKNFGHKISIANIIR